MERGGNIMQIQKREMTTIEEIIYDSTNYVTKGKLMS